MVYQYVNVTIMGIITFCYVRLLLFFLKSAHIAQTQKSLIDMLFLIEI